MKVSFYLIYTFSILLMGHSLIAQSTITESTHKLSGAEVMGYEIEIPFNKSHTEIAWNSYSKSFGKADIMQLHLTYETVFNPSIYNQKTLIFVAINGDGETCKIWAGIDAQGIPKDIYPNLKVALKDYLYDFYLKIRLDAAQKQIDDSEKVASLMSKSFEDLKREERKNLRNQEKNQLKIEKYEKELIQMRQDSVNYISTLEILDAKQNSVNLEIEKIKKLVATYKDRLKEIK